MIGDFCPSCQIGVLRVRGGKFGKFLGCDRFPQCCYVDKTVKFNKKDNLESSADEILKSAGRKDLIL